MKKYLSLSLALLLISLLTACVASVAPPAGVFQEPMAEPVELIVFAAASMTETLSNVIELYKTVAPYMTVTPTYDSSGTLLTQIEEGAVCDVFLSAAQKQMNALDVTKDETATPKGQDYIDSDTRMNLPENKAALVVPEGNAANITSFADLAKAKLIILGNSDVPVGSYSLGILAQLGLDIAALENSGKVAYRSNMKEVTPQVSEDELRRCLRDRRLFRRSDSDGHRSQGHMQAGHLPCRHAPAEPKSRGGKGLPRLSQERRGNGGF